MKKNKKQIIIEIDELTFNDAIKVNYRHKLLVLKREMIKEYNEEIKKYYKQNIVFITGDNDIVKELENVINRIGEKWYMRFFFISNNVATKFVKDIDKHNDKRFDRIKKKHPFLIHGTEEREQTTKIIQSSIAENVGLIKSIPKKFHDDILGDVMRSVAMGGNLQQLTQDLSKRSNQTSKRISFIARDQVAKATALLDRQKSVELGLTDAKWKKSVAGKTHRKDHAEADGKEFDIEKGCLISGEYILPRMKPNCKCSYKLIIKFDKD